MNERISDTLNYPSNYVEVQGSKIHYIEAGEGDPILLLHGIPTSCYLWRNIMPYLAPLGRCIAPDLIGFGRSDKPDITYSITDHINYMTAFIEALGLKKITFVLHGWGSVIGLDYAMKHEKNCKGLVFYEAFLRSDNVDDVSLPFQEQILTLQNQEISDDLSLTGVSFVDKMIPQNAMRALTQEEMDYYRQPFTEKGTGKPLLQYIKELSKGNGAGTVEKIIADYSKRLIQSNLPKLMLYSVPGFVTTIATIMWAKENLKNIEIIEIGEELHFAQESCPALMGETISVWLQGVEQT